MPVSDLNFSAFVIGRLVEGLVELSAEIVDDGGADILRKCRSGHFGCGQKAKNDTLHVIHTLSVCFTFRSDVRRR
ncbi:MAG: hypothetical protein M9905_04825 [Rhizobiaceae bacterium]|nr:hypothetical protein [Rhizobiaceae bacterium]